MNFGDNLPKIIYKDIEIDLEDYRLRITPIKKKTIPEWMKFIDDFYIDHSRKLGNRTVIEFNILDITPDEWGNIFALLDGEYVDVYYHSDMHISEVYKCDITEYHNADWFFNDSIHIKLVQKNIQKSIETIHLYGVNLSPVIGI